jgi:hypothetical protein
MPRKRIFVSCGQLTEDEKNLGQQVLRVIGATNRMEGFFANEAHDAADLNSSLFKELQNCDGFVAIMHGRGEVRFEGKPPTNRGSVWIHQEIAILFYRSFLIGRPVPTRIYTEKSLAHEGLTQFSMINPRPFENNKEVLDDLPNWLAGPIFDEPPALARRDEMFRRLTGAYSAHHWLLLEVIAAHSTEPRDRVNRAFLIRDFSEILGAEGSAHGQDHNKLGSDILQKLVSDGLVNDDYEKVGGMHYYSIKPTWWTLIHDELRNRARIR